jgi:general nucleoside transport system permease protein
MIRALVIAVLAAVAVPSGFLLLAGKAPLATWGALLSYTLGTWAGFSDVLIHAIPLTLIGIGVAVAFRAGIFNLGGDGQLICGAVLAVALAPLLEGLGWFALLLFLFAGFIGGGLIGGLVGWLRARFGANEIIVTIMMNYVALQLLTWVIRGPLQDPMRIFPRSYALATEMQLPILASGTRLHAGIIVALLVAGLMQIAVSRTAFGFRLAVLGESAGAAVYAGINVARVTVAAMALSGAFAGLAGAVEIAGVHQRLQDNFAGGFGLEAIAVALMARLHPIAVPLTAVLFGIFYVGSGALQRQLSVPFPLVWIIEGVVILAYLGFVAAAARNAARTA